MRHKQMFVHEEFFTGNGDVSSGTINTTNKQTNKQTVKPIFCRYDDILI